MHPPSLLLLLLLPSLATLTLATPLLDSRQTSSCPAIHIFGARETTAPQGYGSAAKFINLLLQAYPQATSEAIVYPAAGGSNPVYAASVQAGTKAIAAAINYFHVRCPGTRLVVVGYSQGAQIGDNALCGGGDPNQGVTYTNPLINAAAAAMIKVVIWAGNPRNSPAEKYFHFGSCEAGGFDARPSGFTCPAYAGKIRSYCDKEDPYCCNGNNGAVHQGYGAEYGQDALVFAKRRLG